MSDAKYIPALRFGWLTPIYDPVLRRLMPERALKQRLIAQAQIAAGQHVLDLGAGTGTLTIMLKKTYLGRKLLVWMVIPGYWRGRVKRRPLPA